MTEACMDTGKTTAVLDLLGRISPDLTGSLQRLKPVLDAGLDGVGGANDPMAAAFASGYFPLLNETRPAAEALPARITQQVNAGRTSVAGYLAADHAGAQCFPK